MSYKKGLTKTKYKNMMRMFWTQKWKYERSIEDWVESLDLKSSKWNTPHLKHPYGERAFDILFLALDKLVLEKKLNKLEAENMKKMIEGSPEDAFIAISIMAKLKPKKFKRNVERL